MRETNVNHEPMAVARTPMGSLIERVEPGVYRVCDSARHCRLVNGLWAAREVVRELEVHHRPIRGTTPDAPQSAAGG